MLSGKMTEALNRQINREIYSAYFYLGMAAYAHSVKLEGVANWFTVQVTEELSHAEKMFDYVSSQGNRVMLDEIETPPQDFTSAVDLFRRTLEHEKKVTGLIHNLVEVAGQEGDGRTGEFLQWYVKEQVEEEENAGGVLKKMEDAGEDEKAILPLDEELTART